MMTSDRLKWQQPELGSYFTMRNRSNGNNSHPLAISIDQHNCPSTMSICEKSKEDEENKKQLNDYHYPMLVSPSLLQKESRSASRKVLDRVRDGKVGSASDGIEGSTKEKILKGGKGDRVLMVKPNLKSQKSNNSIKREASRGSSKENSKALAPKPDYIHVRARRGQATDSHSLAERVRREKISERMKFLQDLVPGCNKITGKASILDEIINYVQSLQGQVEFLSMKLASVNPGFDFNIDEFFSKEIDSICSATCPQVGMSCEVVDPSYLQFNSLQQEAARGGLDMAVDHPQLALGRMGHGSSVTWDANMSSSFDMMGEPISSFTEKAKWLQFPKA